MLDSVLPEFSPTLLCSVAAALLPILFVICRRSGKAKVNRRSLRSKNDLAFFHPEGKRVPWFPSMLVVGRPNVGTRETFNRYMDTIWASRIFTNNGPLVQKFEARLREYLEVQHVVVFVNGTIALEALFSTLPKSGEILVPSFTFVATVHAIMRAGHTPVFCDVDPVTLCVDPAAVQRGATEKTVAVVGVHLYGAVCDVESLTRVARKLRVPLFFDAAHAFGCSIKGVKIGSFGNAEMLSFHATKFFHSIEGGAITTTDAAIATAVSKIRSYGMTGKFDDDRTPVHACWGSNGKMSEVSAAMGLTNMEHLDKIFAINKCNMRLYAEALSGIPGIMLYDLRNSTFESNCQYIVVRIHAEMFGMTRRQLAQILAAENIASRPYFFPAVHQLPPYSELMPGAGKNLTMTEQVSKEVLCLPSGETVDEDVVSDVAKLIRFCHEISKQCIQ